MTNDDLIQLKHNFQSILGRVNKVLPELHQLVVDLAAVEKHYDRIALLCEDNIAKPVTSEPVLASYTPSAKPDKGNPLAELMHNLSEADRAKLIMTLESKR